MKWADGPAVSDEVTGAPSSTTSTGSWQPENPHCCRVTGPVTIMAVGPLTTGSVAGCLGDAGRVIAARTPADTCTCSRRDARRASSAGPVLAQRASPCGDPQSLRQAQGRPSVLGAGGRLLR